MGKEFRAVLVFYNGLEIPENIVARISKEIATWCESDIEKISVRTCNENDLSKLLLQQNATIKFDDAEEKCKAGNDAIMTLSSIIDLDTSVALFAINLSTYLMKVLDRKNGIGLTERDKQLLNALVVLGQGSPRTSSLARKYHYTKEIDDALRKIYNRIFDSNGKIKE